MRFRFRRPPFAAACIAAAVVVAIVAIADHRHTGHVMGPAWVSAWYCDHRGTRCDETMPDAIENRWEARELTYKTTEVVIAGLFVAGIALPLRIRR